MVRVSLVVRGKAVSCIDGLDEFIVLAEVELSLAGDLALNKTSEISPAHQSLSSDRASTATDAMLRWRSYRVRQIPSIGE